MEQRLGSPSRDRSPLNSGRLAPRQPQPHYDSASDEEQEPPPPPPPEPKRKQPVAPKRLTQQARDGKSLVIFRSYGIFDE